MDPDGMVRVDATLERCLVAELDALVAALPSPLTVYRAVTLFGGVGRLIFAIVPPLRWVLAYKCFVRIFDAAEALCGFIRTHEDLPGYLAHLDRSGGEFSISHMRFTKVLTDPLILRHILISNQTHVLPTFLRKQVP